MPAGTLVSSCLGPHPCSHFSAQIQNTGQSRSRLAAGLPAFPSPSQGSWSAEGPTGPLQFVPGDCLAPCADTLLSVPHRSHPGLPCPWPVQALPVSGAVHCQSTFWHILPSAWTIPLLRAFVFPVGCPSPPYLKLNHCPTRPTSALLCFSPQHLSPPNEDYVFFTELTSRPIPRGQVLGSLCVRCCGRPFLRTVPGPERSSASGCGMKELCTASWLSP